MGIFNLFKKSIASKPEQVVSRVEQKSADETSTLADRTNDQPYLPKIGKRHRVVGLNYRKTNVMKLATENPLYNLNKAAILKQELVDTYIHKYIFADGPTELVQEPDNPHDPNAIKVVVAGQHIGYIKAGSCAHLNKVINEGRIEKILCRISGGPYKGAFQDEVELADAGFTGKPTYLMETGTDDLSAEIRVIEIPPIK